MGAGRSECTAGPSLLLTAHRSKGLEFDHVVILNGGWKALSKGEDGEAPRRLFYVAMTRARRSLSVVTMVRTRLCACRQRQ